MSIFSDYEQEFKINNRDGQLKEEKSYRIQSGKNNIIISAPHSVRHMQNGNVKSADLYTGAIAKFVAEKTNSHLIVKCAFNKDNPNSSNNSNYKKELANHIKQNNIKFLIDIHGASLTQPFNVDVGTFNGQNINNRKEVEKIIVNAFAKNNIDEVFFNHTFIASANTVSRKINEQTGIIAFQLEINRRLRKTKHNLNLVCNSIIEIVNNLNKLENTKKK